MSASAHFTEKELSCRCGCGFGTGPVDVDPMLLVLLEELREHFGVPIRINCACRCAKHNAEVGGEQNSYHLKGMAADIAVLSHSPETVADYLCQTHDGGVGRYDTFTHVDVGPRRRWDNRSKGG